MRWSVTGGVQVDPRGFLPLAPAVVLYEFDVPRIFTAETGYGKCLVYLSEYEQSLCRYLVAPTNEEILDALRGGSRTVYDALNQAWIWVVDCDGDLARSAFRTVLREIPADARPDMHTMLTADLEPMLQLRMVGPSLEEGQIPASVVRQAIDGASTALKKIAERVFDRRGAMGRPDNSLRQYFDLWTQHFAFHSFEISFRKPFAEGQLRLPPPEEEDRELAEIGENLATALAWAENGDEAIEPDLLKSLEKLVPPPSGLVETVEVRGKIFPRRDRPYSLTRHSTSRVRQALLQLRNEERVITANGQVREFDKDKLTFTLRDGVEWWICSISLDQFDDVMEFFQSDTYVSVTGRQQANRRNVEVVAIARATVSSLGAP